MPALRLPSARFASRTPTSHDYSLRPDRYHDGRRTLAHLYTVPVQYAFDGIRNCPHCRENPGARTCRGWKEARKSVRVLHREARRIAKDVTDLDGVTGGCIATVYQFADGSVAYFALDAPAWREADEIAGWAPGPGAPYPGDPRASGGAALKWCLKGLPALFQ